MKRSLVTFSLLAAALFAFANANAMKVFTAKYSVKSASVLGKAKCTVCHGDAKAKTLNSYGKDLQGLMKAAGTKTLAASMLGSVEGKDSDGDGMKNGDEIRADRLPGKSG